MPLSEWTRMAIASAVAIVAISFLAIDAGVDVNAGAIAKRIAHQAETAQASVVEAAMGQRQLAFAVQAWARRGHHKQPLEQCLAMD